MLKALIAGIGVALMTGPLGCFIAWRRLAYFGDTIAHAALLGVVMALTMNINVTLGVVLVSVILAVIIARGERYTQLASDTRLGIAAHGALALGLVLLSLSRSITVDVNGLLFGDILAVNAVDITIIYIMAVAVLGMLIMNWRNLMRLVLHEDIAQVEGVDMGRLRLLLVLTIAMTVAVSIKIVGILLMTSLLIIPAAAVRGLARTPTHMAVLSVAAGILSVSGGLYASLQLDTPTGPTIILAALGIFMLGYFFARSNSATTGT